MIEGKNKQEEEKGNKVIYNYNDKLYNELWFNNEFKDYYDKILEENNNIRKYNRDQKTQEFNFNELKSLIRNLKNNKATGDDNITNEALKCLNDKSIHDLLKIFNELYKNSLVPNEWNNGIITMIYKMKGEYGDPKNYRGITVSSNVLKLMEKLMANRYSKEIEMTEFQGGSKKGSSTRDHIFVILALIKKIQMQRIAHYIPGYF